MTDGLVEMHPFHVLHGHLIYRLWTFFHGEHIRTNIYKTSIKDMDNLKIRITQEIQSIEQNTLHNVFLEIGKD